MEPKVSKYLFIDMHDNKEGQDLEKYQDKDSRYVFLLLYPQNESNGPTDLGEGTRSLNHLLCISKLPHQIIANFVLEFLGGGGLKAQKNNLY